MTDADEIVFHDREVTITRVAARFGAVSVPIASIGGVLVKPPKTGAIMIVAILLLVLAISKAHDPIAIPAFGVAVVIAIVAYLRPSRLVLRGAGGEKSALVSRDPRPLRPIKAAIATLPRPNH